MQQLSKDFEIMRTSEGYMVYDHQIDDYLHDAQGDNCFNRLEDALNLCQKRIKQMGD